jgi:hypothetical protein
MSNPNLESFLSRTIQAAAATITVSGMAFSGASLMMLPALAQSGAMPEVKSTEPAAEKLAEPVKEAVPEVKAAPAATAPELVGQCRAVNKQTPLYKDRNTTSEAATLLKINEKVTLAENAGSSGLISVSAPAKGFVLMANLKSCPGQKPPTKPPTSKPTTPTTPVSSCRVVVQKQGLSIRQEPGAGAVLGGVALNEKVTLADPAETKTATDGRDWVKLAKPMAGWVSEGFKEQAFKNLAVCN